MKYAFGPVSVDAGARLVSSAGASRHLTPKAFELLLLLLERRPNAVSKDQIYARVWPETFVAESSLQSLIHEIRQAIDDPASPTSWIRTIHGTGYSFCGEVVVSDDPVPTNRVENPAAWLVSESSRVALQGGENIIGRGTDDIVEIEEPTISRRHARITIADSVIVEDLDSKNGTWVDDKRVTAPHTLPDGSVVRLGSATFTFRLARPPRSTESAVSPRTGDDR